MNYNKQLPYKFILKMSIFAFIVNTIFTSVIFKFTNTNIVTAYYSVKSSIIITAIFALIISPLVETLLFQTFVLTLLNRDWIKLNAKYRILISALLFSSAHIVYNTLYALGAFLSGVIFAYSYLTLDSRNDNPILNTALIHSCHNALALFINSVK
ncbi:MAG: CPBP family intramembrane metalloprotease [Alkaliphilus sp.]|nr:CPBP family intramembrane metalloprotease [Alkaliphilus sp.]